MNARIERRPSQTAGAPQGILLACATVLIVIAITPLLPILPRIAAAFPEAGSLAPAAVVLPSLFIGLLSVPAGFLGDRIGRRRLLIGASLVLALTAPLPYVFQSFPALMICRAVTGMALAAIITSAVALTGDYFPPSERQRWLALQSGIPGIAAIACGALGGVLGDIDWRYTLLLNGVALLFAGAVALLTSDRMRLIAMEPAVAQASAADAPFPWTVVAGAAAMIAWSSLILFPLAFEIGFLFAEKDVSTSSVAGLGSAAIAGGAVMGAIAAGLLPAAAGRSKLLIAFGCGGVGMLLFVFTRDLPVAMIGCLIGGVGQGVVIPVLTTSLLNGTPEAYRGRAVGVFQSTLYLSQFCSPLIARTVSRDIGPSDALLVYGGLALLTGLALLLGAVLQSRAGRD